MNRSALRRRSLLPLLVMAVASAAACGGASQPAVKTAPVPSSKPADGSGSASVTPDLSQVPEPSGLVAIGRVANLGKVLAGAHKWSQLPMPKPEAIAEALTSEAVGDLVDIEQPIDFAVAVTGSGLKQKQQLAVSAALRDPEKAKAAFAEHFKLVPGDNGALDIEGLGRPAHPKAARGEDDDDDDGPKTADSNSDKRRDDDNEERRHCRIAPAFGKAPMRLVCGWSKAAMTTLTPYLTRTATRAASPSDVHVELRTGPFKQVIAEQKPMIKGLVGSVVGMRGYNPGIRELAGAFGLDVADFALDLDSTSIDAQLGDDSLTGTMTTKLGATTSTIARLATQHPERTAEVPATFWQLPKDAEFAFFQRGIEPREFDGARDLVVAVVGGQLGRDGVEEADKQAIVLAMKKLFSGASGVYATGLDAARVRRAFADLRQKDRSWSSAAERAELRRAAVESILGWRVFGIEEPPAKLIAAAKEVAAAFARPGVAKAYKAKFKDGLVPSVKIAAAPKGVTLPKDSVHLELEMYAFHDAAANAPSKPGGTPATPPKPEAKADKPVGPPKPIKIHLVIAGDGGRTWIGVGADEAMLASKLSAVLAGGSDGDRLASRAGLEALKSAKAGAGGFVTQRGLPAFSQQISALLSESFYGTGEHYDDMTAAQHGGATPIPFTVTAQDASTMVATTTLTKPAIEDFVVAWIKKMVPSYYGN